MLKIRKAQIEDCDFLYSIRNDPKVREVSFSSDAISYETHVNWFKSSLTNPGRRIFVIHDDSSNLGVVRFDMNEPRTEALVSINVSSNSWGKGVGSFALNEGQMMIKSEFPSLVGIIAKVMADNAASVSLFTKNNYKTKILEFYKEVK